MYSLYLTMPTVPEALNKKLNAHWRTRHKTNLAWDSMIAALCVGKKPKVPITDALIILTRHSARMLDFDGLVGSMKPVVDALVTCGVLSDDSWKVTGPWQVLQFYRAKKDGQMLEIRIIERLN